MTSRTALTDAHVTPASDLRSISLLLPRVTAKQVSHG
jgi:hypothetical protein